VGQQEMATEAELLKRAKEMRRNLTEPEKRLWRCVSNAKLGGYKFRRQHVVVAANAIIDLFCPAVGLGIEIDGDTHDRVYDEHRDYRLEKLGFTILRFGNADVISNPDGVAQVILTKASTLPRRWLGRTAPPQPLP
jgi:very-short-patch-repair endonuclease